MINVALQVHFKHSITIGLLGSLCYFGVLKHALESCLVDYNNPTAAKYIIYAALIAYNFGLYVLSNTSYRYMLYGYVMLYSGLYYFYARVYIYVGLMIPTSAYLFVVAFLIVGYQNKFCQLFEDLYYEIEEGEHETVASDLIFTLKNQLIYDLTHIINDEIQVTHIRQKHKIK